MYIFGHRCRLELTCTNTMVNKFKKFKYIYICRQYFFDNCDNVHEYSSSLGPRAKVEQVEGTRAV